MATKWQPKLSKVNLIKVKSIVASDIPYSLKEEIKKLEDSPRRDLNIVALYFEHRKPDLQNRKQYETALKRHLKPAGVLKDFTDQQILKALDKASKIKNKKPTIIISNTIKGKGVSFMELNHKFHGKAPNDEEYKKAIEEIEKIDVKKFK